MATDGASDGSSDPAIDGPGRAALRHIDEALANRPKKSDELLSAATLCLSEFRDAMIARQRAHGLASLSRERLEQANAIISVVMGVHFPLGDQPWHELEKARGWLATLID